MAGFDSSKDKILKKWHNENTGLCLSINQYDNGEPKLQIGPRIFKKKDGSDRAPVRAGRLSVKDLDWLYEKIDEIRDDITQYIEPTI